MSSVLLRGLIALALTGFAIGSASAGFVSILNVDFNNTYPDGTSSPTTAATDANGVGFQGYSLADGPAKTFGGLDPALTSGAVTVTLGNVYGWRDRSYFLSSGGGMSGPFRDLYTDFVTFNGPNSLAPALILSGLNPDTDYTLTFQSFDAWVDAPGAFTTVFTDVTAGGATNGLTTAASFHTGVDPSGGITPGGLAGGTASFTVRSNAAGVLAFAVGDPNGTPSNYSTQVNGFELSSPVTAVPEPSSLALLGLGGGWLLVCRGRRGRGRKSPA